MCCRCSKKGASGSTDLIESIHASLGVAHSEMAASDEWLVLQGSSFRTRTGRVQSPLNFPADSASECNGDFFANHSERVVDGKKFR
jgi:hypothetical protein